MLLNALTTRAPGANAAINWLVDKFPTSTGVKGSGLAVIRIDAVDKNLILPLWKTCKRLRHIVPGHGKKHHFASYCLFPCSSGCTGTESHDNFPQALGASAIAKFNLMT